MARIKRKSNLPPESQAWAKEVQKKTESNEKAIEALVKADKNASKENGASIRHLQRQLTNLSGLQTWGATIPQVDIPDTNLLTVPVIDGGVHIPHGRFILTVSGRMTVMQGPTGDGTSFYQVTIYPNPVPGTLDPAFVATVQSFGDTGPLDGSWHDHFSSTLVIEDDNFTPDISFGFDAEMVVDGVYASNFWGVVSQLSVVIQALPPAEGF